MDNPSYKDYKGAKRMFANLLHCKETDFEKKCLEEVTHSHDFNVRSFWKHVNSKRESVSSVHAILKDW
jgi:hypothetical protein